MSTTITEARAVSAAPSQSYGSKPRSPIALVRQTKVVVEHQLPDRTDDDAGYQDRQDEDGAVEHPPRRHLAAQQRQKEAQEHLPGDRSQREDQRVRDAGQEQWVASETGIVSQTHRTPHRPSLGPSDIVEAGRGPGSPAAAG